MFSKLEIAYHEAGHAVAAFYLKVGIESVTIIANEISLGCVTKIPTSDNMENAIKEADLDSSWGGFINGRTRRYVESQIMVCFAGSLVLQVLTGKEDHEIGSGLNLVDNETAQKYAEKFGGDWSRIIEDGDLRDAMDLAKRVSGSDEECAAYLEWLKERTKNLIRKRGFMESVKALATALLEKETITGKEVRSIITSTLTSLT